MTLPLTGAGKSSFNFWNTSNTYKLIFRKEPEERNGKKYLVVEKVIFQSNPEKVGYYLENLFNRNKQLGDTMNKLLNDNWEIIWDELKPLVLDAISEAYLLLSNRVFSHIPMDASGWKKCEKNDPERSKCLEQSINDAIKSLVNGNKKLGVLPIDPFRFGRIRTKGDSNGPVALDFDFKDFVLYNLKNLIITSVKLEGNSLKMTASVPGTLEADSPYIVTGKILALPLTGDGRSNFTFWDGNFTFDVTFRREPEVKNGKQYLVVEKFVERAFPKKVGFYLGNLFNGNKQLGDQMNKVLNDNWELVWSELKGLFEDAISEGFLQLSNRVFSHIPMEDIGLM